MSTTTTSNESTVFNDDGSKTVIRTTHTKFPDGTTKIVKNTRTIPPPRSADGELISSTNNRDPGEKVQTNPHPASAGEIHPSSSGSGPPVSDTATTPCTAMLASRSITRSDLSNCIGTDENDDTFSVRVEWPRDLPGSTEGLNEKALQNLEGDLGSGGGTTSSSRKDGQDIGGTYAGDDDSSSDEESFNDESSPPSDSAKTVKWKLALLFLSSIYELISIITKTQLFLALYELESCFRCDYDNEDLITALFIPSLMFFIFMIMKESGKVVAAFLTVCCDASFFCGDETVWPRNLVTIPMYFIKSTIIIPSHRDDYSYEYSQSHTLLNLCVEDLPFLVFGIYGVQLDVKAAGFGVFISFIGAIVSFVEAVRHVRNS